MKLRMKNKSALIFSNQGLSPLHLGYELEIINDLISNEYEVYSITCDNVLSSCFFNPTHNILACAICEARTKENHKHFKKIKSVSLKQYKFDYKKRKFSSLNELIDLEYDGVNIGRGIASSVISLFREYDINKIDRVNEVIEEQHLMVINTILNFKKYINDYKPEVVYLFNGRFAEIYALCQLCEKLNVTYKTYDTGSNRSRYSLRENTSVHNIASFQKDMENIKATLDKDVIIKEATNLYKQRIKGNQGEVYNFLTLQESGKLPKGFDSNKNNIAIFNSSEDEMKVIKDWQFDLYQNQNDALIQLLDYFKDDDTIHFYLRIHPNLLGIDNSQTKEIKTLSYKNLTVIEADEPTDTYALVSACDKTMCFGSTVGVEASFLGKPSILLGSSFYRGLDCVYEPQSYSELFSLIVNQGLKPKESFNIYLYIYTIQNTGIEYDDFVFKGITGSTYKGVEIKKIYFKTILKLVKYLKSFSLWSRMTKLILKQKLSFKNITKLKSHTLDKTHLKK